MGMSDEPLHYTPFGMVFNSSDGRKGNKYVIKKIN
jgi:hypothetical protein